MTMEISLEKARRSLRRYTPEPLDETMRKALIPAATFAPLFMKDGRLHLLLTVRTQSVKHHKGQISFPGGRLEDSDDSLLHCALREMEEEIGVLQSSPVLFGQLDEAAVISGYRITPFVGSIPYPFDFVLCPDEVERVLLIPVEEFLNPDIHEMTVKEYMNQDYAIHFYHVQGETVWGATGRILTQLFELAFGYIPPKYRAYLESKGRKF